MRPLEVLRLRLRSLFRRRRVDAELRAELDFHLAAQTEELIAAGMAPAEARLAARRALGNLGSVEEECRDQRQTRGLETFLQDLRYALRALRRSPVFTATATLTLALGIGANTAIFSLTEALMLRPLPVEAPERLLAIGNPWLVHSLSRGSVRADFFSVPMYRELARNQVFDALLASGRVGRVTAGGVGAREPETVRGRLVSANYFVVLGVQASRGRTFTPDEDRTPGAAPLAVISHDYWLRRFGGDPTAIGSKLTLNGHPFTVIGVTPPGFFGEIVGNATDLWVPLSMQPQLHPGRDFLERWDTNWLLLLGRLAPGVEPAAADAAIQALFARIVATRGGGAIAEDLVLDQESLAHVPIGAGGTGFSVLRRRLAEPLSTLMGVVGLVLLIACVNIASLLLERATARQKEINVRLALGAGRFRLVRQLLTESLVLALLGGAVGVLVAFWADAGLLRLLAVPRGPALDLRPNMQVLGFTALVSVLTGMLFGLVPALHATRGALAPALRERSRSLVGAGSGRWPLGKVLVVSQLALSLLLLTGAGLFARTLANLQRLDLGYERDGLLTLRIDPLSAGYEGERLGPLALELLARLRALPGAQGVTVSQNGFFSGTESSTSIAIVGRPPIPDPDDDVAYDRVGPDYFDVVGIPILRGRGIGARDVAGSPRVAVLNETMARAYFHGQEPIGQCFAETNQPDVVYEVVGVSGDAHDHDLRGPVGRRFYTPFLQSAAPLESFNFAIRTASPQQLTAAVRAALRALDPRVTILDLSPLDVNVQATMRDEVMVAKLSAAFGLLALVLASIGLYGVVSHATSRRTNEIGIRMVLGAGRRRVLWMVLRETLALVLAGIAIGVPAVLLAARAVSGRLYGVAPHDPTTLLAATAVLLAVALLAGAIPGSRAARVDPSDALRHD